MFHNWFTSLTTMKLALCSCIMYMYTRARIRRVHAPCGAAQPISALSTWSIFLFEAHRRIKWQHGEWGVVLYLVASTDSSNIRSNRADRGIKGLLFRRWCNNVHYTHSSDICVCVCVYMWVRAQVWVNGTDNMNWCSNHTWQFVSAVWDVHNKNEEVPH